MVSATMLPWNTNCPVSMAWWWLLVSYLISWTWASTQADPKYQGGEQLSISACINQTNKKIELNCGTGFMIRINALKYGHGPKCGYTEGDCVKEDKESHLSCIGRASCEINLPSGDYGRKLPNCEEYSTYLQVDYQCIPVAESYDICRTPQLSRQWAYIHTPRYPYNYDHHTNCSLHLLLQQDQKIRLHVLDFDLEPGSNNDCRDDLYIRSPLDSNTMCGNRKSGQIITSHENTMDLTFNSDSQGHNKGFWLYYEADPLRPDPTTTTSTSTTSTTSATTKSQNTKDVTTSAKGRPPPPEPSTQTQSASQSQLTTTESPTSKLPIAAVVGGVLGAVFFILLILVIILICRNIHNKKEKEQKEVIFSNSANYLNSKVGGGQLQGTPGPYIQNNLNLKSNHLEEDKLYYKDELVHKV